MKRIELVDLKRQHKSIKEEIERAMEKVIMKSEFILGEEVKKFEEEFSNYIGSKFAIGVDSGTSALQLSMEALGIRKGDKVIVPAFTFFSTAASICHVGAKPVFVDVDENTANIDVNAIEDCLRKNEGVKAIIPVHLYGQPADMESILRIAEKYNLFVIEDAAQAHGAMIKLNTTWRKVGSIGITGCFSFYPAKNLGALGDGGVITTNNEKLQQKLKMLRDCGRKEKYTHEILGYTKRLDNLQAALLRIKLKKLDLWNKERIKSANYYNELLSGVVQPIKIMNGTIPVYHMYVIRVEKRNELRDFLLKNGIVTGIHYPLPLHLQPVFKFLNYKKGDFKNSEKLSSEVLSLPIFPGIKKQEIEYVCEKIKKFFKS